MERPQVMCSLYTLAVAVKPCNNLTVLVPFNHECYSHGWQSSERSSACFIWAPPTHRRLVGCAHVGWVTRWLYSQPGRLCSTSLLLLGSEAESYHCHRNGRGTRGEVETQKASYARNWHSVLSTSQSKTHSCGQSQRTGQDTLLKMKPWWGRKRRWGLRLNTEAMVRA